MSDRLTIISRSGRVFEMVNYWQVLLAHGPLQKSKKPDRPFIPQSVIFALRALIWPRLVLLSRRLRWELRVALLGLRLFGMTIALLMSSCSRLKASSRFCSWLRCSCALMTITPSEVDRTGG